MDITNIVSVLLMMIVFATLIQFIVDRIKEILPKSILNRIPVALIACLIGVLFAFTFEIKVFELIGLNANNGIIDYIFTGLILSAGSPAIHELISKLRESREYAGKE